MNEIALSPSAAVPAAATTAAVAAPAGGACAGGDPLVFAVLDAAGAIQGRLDAALEAVGLSLAKYLALRQLAAAGEPLTLGELAARRQCVRSNVTQLVDRLESDGLVRRIDDPVDRRAIRAVLTPLGIEREAAGAEALAQAQAAAVERVPVDEREPLRRLLALLR